MTIVELITKLQAMPQDAKVLAWEEVANTWIEVIEVTKHGNTIHLETQYDTF